MKKVSLTFYGTVETVARAAVLICPGGGYASVSPREGDAIAKWLNAIGIAAFVLDYRVAPERFPAPFEDCSRSLRYIRAQAETYNIDPKKIGIMGFSAGGHLAATLCCHFNEDRKLLHDEIDNISARPALSILAYPVIAWNESYTHQGSFSNLLGGQPAPELGRYLSLEKNVRPATPPTFLWHTADDTSVPVANTYMYAAALGAQGIPHEAHIFQSGPHGLANGITNSVYYDSVSNWRGLCEQWLRRQEF